jgi:hypothetical protein
MWNQMIVVVVVVPNQLDGSLGPESSLHTQKQVLCYSMRSSGFTEHVIASCKLPFMLFLGCFCLFVDGSMVDGESKMIRDCCRKNAFEF